MFMYVCVLGVCVCVCARTCVRACVRAPERVILIFSWKGGCELGLETPFFGRRTLSRSLCVRVRLYVQERQYATVCSRVVCVRVWVCVCVYAPRVRLLRFIQRSGFYELRFGEWNQNCFRVRISSPNFRIFAIFCWGGGCLGHLKLGAVPNLPPPFLSRSPLRPTSCKILIFFDPIFEKFRGFLIFGVLNFPANRNSASILSAAFVPRFRRKIIIFSVTFSRNFRIFFRLN